MSMSRKSTKFEEI